MTTEKQIIANRLNAQKSTGPRTPQGKTITSQNALSHGLLSSRILLTSEDPDQFEPFYRSMISELTPIGPLEFLLTERIIAFFWRLRRAGQMESAVLNILCSQRDQRDRFLKPFKFLLSNPAEHSPANPPQPEPSAETILGRVVKSDFQNDNLISRLLQYEGRMERSLYKTLCQLQKLQYLRTHTQPVSNINQSPGRGDVVQQEHHTFARSKSGCQPQNEPNLNIEETSISLPKTPISAFSKYEKTPNEPNLGFIPANKDSNLPVSLRILLNFRKKLLHLMTLL